MSQCLQYIYKEHGIQNDNTEKKLVQLGIRD